MTLIPQFPTSIAKVEDKKLRKNSLPPRVADTHCSALVIESLLRSLDRRNGLARPELYHVLTKNRRETAPAVCLAE